MIRHLYFCIIVFSLYEDHTVINFDVRLIFCAGEVSHVLVGYGCVLKLLSQSWLILLPKIKK